MDTFFTKPANYPNQLLGYSLLFEVSCEPLSQVGLDGQLELTDLLSSPVDIVEKLDIVEDNRYLIFFNMYLV